MIQPAAAKRDKPVRRMPVINFLLHPFFADAVVGLLVSALIFVLVLSAISPEKYELKVGDILSEPIAAPRDVEDVRATRERILQARDRVNDIYTLDQTITNEVVAEVEGIFEGMKTVRDKAAEKLQKWEEQQQELIRQWEQSQQQEEPGDTTSEEENITGTSNEEEQEPAATTQPPIIKTEPDLDQLYNEAFLQEMQQYIPIQLSRDDIRAIIGAEQRDLNQLHQKLIDTLKEMMETGIKQEQLPEFKTILRDTIQGMTIPNELKMLGINIGVPLLKANLLYDPEKTLLEKQKAAEAVEKVIYKKGQFIVQAGQPITEAQFEMLGELGLLKNDTVDFPLYGGVFIVVIICIGLIALYLVLFEKPLLFKPLVILMAGVILCLVTGLTYAAALFNIYLIPAAMAGMLMSVLINTRVGIVFNVIMAVLTGVISGMHISPVAMTMVGGMVGISLLKNIQHRNSLVWAGLGAAAGNFLTVAGIELLIQGGWIGPLYSSLWGVLGGLLAAVLTIGTLPIWENLFGVVTPIKLVELGNPNHPVLKRLLMETPGTYHHSIIVANLAESAADAIGANGLLARVGAYYHDIGKLERPYFFKENQLTYDNPHERIDPELSTRIITAHANDGLEIARKYKVPDVIQKFITEHHGTTPVIYFFHKAKNLGNKEVSLDDFRYPGPKPQSRETAVVMLADTVEAAVRAMTDYTPEKVEELIRKLIREKMDDGQFDECDLTIRDMNIIASSFTSVISGIFHERVKYPSVDLNAERTRKQDDLVN
ncbi:MAG TPA: HDIG domain-containing protein [Clostridiales bacterium]|nr:HDIG domain-containing protein [Clostridiales bacterium]